MDDATLKKNAALLLQWYGSHFRALPWRMTPTPYRVWISEIMLQQTRIEAVRPYYDRFMAALPNVYALAAVDDERLMKLWEGLGYYSRARNLKKAAAIIADRYHGELPADYDLLLALPGIGEYTAGAIASIAYSIPVPAVDGNVMRVLARLTGDETDVLSAGAKRHYAAIAARMLPPSQPGRFNQALMELGETVCLPHAAPDCGACPLYADCVSYAAGSTARLPVRVKRSARRIENRTVAVVILRGDVPRVLLHKRPDTGLLAGMWELPNDTADGTGALPDTLAPLIRMKEALPAGKHLFTHIEWRLSGAAYVAPQTPLPDDFRAVSFAELQREYALPSAFRCYTALLPRLLREEEY